MADKRYKITDSVYEIIDNFQDDDTLLIARKSENRYMQLPWSKIQEKLDLKANLIENDFGEIFGLAKVNEQGIVVDVKTLTASDIPNIDITQVNELQDKLDEKADKTFASETDDYVLAQTSHTIKNKEIIVESGSGSSAGRYNTNELEITKTFVSPNDLDSKTEKTVLYSNDGSITFEEVDDGISLKVVPERAQLQADWEEDNEVLPTFIKNKPNLADVALSGSYNDLTEKPIFNSGNYDTLSIEQDSSTNTYTFTVPILGKWGTITGELDDQEDLANKFNQYYTSTQVDNLISESTKGVLVVKGYTSENDPTTYISDLTDGICWIQSTGSEAPSGKTFTCQIYQKVSSEYRWVDFNYTASDFDVWVNKNSSEDNSFFWLGSKWERLDFDIDLSNYYSKDETDTLLEGKQASLSGVAGNVVTFTNTPGQVSETVLSTVATSGNYEDLSNKPIIPAAQVQTDWNATTGMGSILNKPTLATVATSGNYSDLTNKPTIPAAQIQSDWEQEDDTKLDYIKNKPTVVSNVFADNYTITVLDSRYNSSNGTILLDKKYILSNDIIDYQVFWNGLYQTRYVDYNVSPYGNTLNQESLYVGNTFNSLYIDGAEYSKSGLSYNYFTMTFSNGIKVELNSSTEMIEIYKNDELIKSLYTKESQALDYEEFINNSYYVITDVEIVSITEINETPDLIFKSFLNTAIKLETYPEFTDTNDIIQVTILSKTIQKGNSSRGGGVI